MSVEISLMIVGAVAFVLGGAVGVLAMAAAMCGKDDEDGEH